ncbi:MAG: hypothetical protein K2X77_18405 [Candidatus Obscuribacterales bacterium]|nr:hypothetical protein [Candidatus Obscuribacterales bacterium]
MERNEPGKTSKGIAAMWCQACRQEGLALKPQQIIGSYYDENEKMPVRRLAPADALGWLSPIV